MIRRFRFPLLMRVLIRVLATFLLIAVLTVAGLYAFAGTYGFNVIVRRGASVGVTVTADDPRLSASMRLALHDPSGPVQAGPLDWRWIAPGFEVADMPVIADGRAVDRIALARIDPARFRFVVRNAPAGNRELGDWMYALGAALVINGSYFTRTGEPDTPLVSAGVRLGPRHYVANHGASRCTIRSPFTISPTRTGTSSCTAPTTLWCPIRCWSHATQRVVSMPILAGSPTAASSPRTAAAASSSAPPRRRSSRSGPGRFPALRAPRPRCRAQPRWRPRRLPGHRAQRLPPRPVRPLGACAARSRYEAAHAPVR